MVNERLFVGKKEKLLAFDCNFDDEVDGIGAKSDLIVKLKFIKYFDFGAIFSDSH